MTDQTRSTDRGLSGPSRTRRQSEGIIAQYIRELSGQQDAASVPDGDARATLGLIGRT